MIRELLRAIGIGCLLAGGILYVTEQQTSDETLKKKLEAANEELNAVKKELAVSQTLTSKSGSEQDTIPSEDEIDKEVIEKEFTVKPGITPAELSRELESEKLIDDAGEFERYLIENDYTRKIKVGTYTLRSDMRFPDIAKIFLHL